MTSAKRDELAKKSRADAGLSAGTDRAIAWETGYSFGYDAGVEAIEKRVERLHQQLATHCGHPGAAEGCRLVLKALKELEQERTGGKE